MDIKREFRIVVFSLLLIVILIVIIFFNTNSTINKQKIIYSTKSSFQEQKIKLNPGDFLLCFYNGQINNATVFKIINDRTGFVYIKSNNYYEDMLSSEFWQKDIQFKKSFKLTKKEYNKLKNNINKVFIKEYEYSYAQDGNNVIIVTNTNENEIIAICNKKEVKLLNNEISKISFNISSVLDKHFNVLPKYHF